MIIWKYFEKFNLYFSIFCKSYHILIKLNVYFTILYHTKNSSSSNITPKLVTINLNNVTLYGLWQHLKIIQCIISSISLLLASSI